MKTQDPRIVIIGAGMSGMLMAIRLLKAGITSFTLIEKADRPGGTWRENTYPGLQCDVPAYMYAYSFEPNPECTRRYATGAELQAYFLRVFEKYGLAAHTRFNTQVTSSVWSRNGWTVTINDDETLRADFVIAATGILHHPKRPDIAGLDSFRGEVMHSAQWRHDVPVAGQRVGIVGTGSTAVQIISAIADQVGHLDVFQRTPQWVVPALDTIYGSWRQPLLRRAPFLAGWIGKGYEKVFDHVTGELTSNPVIAPTLEVIARANLRLQVKDPMLRKRLTPDYRAGCKRLVIADNFYAAMQQPNVSLVTEGITKIEAAGIRTADGRLHALDVLVLATGFEINFCLPIQITGRGGLTLQDAWQQRMQAYRSLSMPGFPNFFVLPGPHSPFGNFSIITVSEIQTNYVMQLIELFRRGEAQTIEASAEATRAYNAAMAEGASGTVWSSGCQSWYLDADGLPMLWPWGFSRFRREMRRPRLADYVIGKRGALQSVEAVRPKEKTA